MVNTLIISDRECIKGLINYFQPKILGKIDVAEDFDRGLNEIFNKRPATVFIQNEISGVFAETVTKHIRGLLASDSPRIILLWESALNKNPEKGDFDDTFDLSLPEQQLIATFRKLLLSVPGVQWRSQSPGEEGDLEENSFSSPVVSKSKLSGVQTSLLNDEFTNDDLNEDTKVQIYPVDLENDVLPDNILRPSKHITPLFKMLAGLIIIGLGIAIYSLFPYIIEHDTVPIPSATISAPTRAVQLAKSSSSFTAKHLFSFIPQQARDVAYTIKNPGWERFADREMEYLLFSENGVIRAIQVIAIREEGISKDFFHSVLREVSGGEDFIITSNSVVKGYDVQEGMATGSADIAVYTNQKTGVTVAFVISFT